VTHTASGFASDMPDTTVFRGRHKKFLQTGNSGRERAVAALEGPCSQAIGAECNSA